MATSGNVYTNKYGGNRGLVFSWSLSSQDTTSNSSVISYTLKGYGDTGAGYYMAGPIKLIVNGVTVYNDSTRIQLRNGTTVNSGTRTIAHGADGTKSFSVSISAAIYSSAINCTGSGSFALPDIPKYAVITAAPNFNDEDNPTISYKNQLGNSVTSLKACISLDGSYDDIRYRDISKTGTTYTFVLTNAERAVLREATTTSNSRSVKFFVRTVVDGQTYNNAVTKTLTIVNAAPTITANVTDSNSVTVGLTGDSNKLIKYFSNATFNYSCTALKGSTITSKRFSNGSVSFEDGTSGTFSNVEIPTFEARATDSRGNTTTKTIVKTMVEYFRPTCTIGSASVSPQGVLTFSASGNYFNDSFGASVNERHVYYRYKAGDDSYSNWAEIASSATNNAWTASTSVTGCDYTRSNNLQVKITDSLSSTSKTITINTRPIFDWDDETFNFNIMPQYQGVNLVEADFTNKWAKFSSGLLVQWGIGNVAANAASGTISFNRNFSQIQGVFLQNNYTNSKSIILSTSGLTNSDFKANVYDTSTRTTPTVQTYFYWMAVGRG